MDIDKIKSQIGSIVGEIGEAVESGADRVRSAFDACFFLSE